jgi:hypothetical protein
MITISGIPWRTQCRRHIIDAVVVILVRHMHRCRRQWRRSTTTMPSGRRTCRGIGRGHPSGRRQRQKREEGARRRQRWRLRQRRHPRLCGRMTGPSSTARRGRRRFSRPDGGNAEEDRGSDGDNGTPDDRGSGEERDDGSALPATAVNPLDSAKHAYRRWLEGGEWRNNATATDDDGDDSGIVEEVCRTGGWRSLTRPGGRSTQPPVVAYRHCRTGSG